MSSTSFTETGDQSLSAIAAARGQILESIVSDVTSSDHIVASPPRMSPFWRSSSGESEGRGSLR